MILEAAPSSYPGLSNGANGVVSINGVNGHTNGLHHKNGTNGTSTPDHFDRQLFVLSARSEKSLVSYFSSFDEYLNGVAESNEFTKNLSYTLGQRRTHFQYRVAATASSAAELKEKLSTAKVGKTRDRVIAFVFTGQGAQ